MFVGGDLARGTWDDFTDKWGFQDGETTEGRDYRARNQICKLLNPREDMRAAGVRAIPFDRPGVHNGCMIIVVPDQPGLTDEELEQKWMEHEFEAVHLPETVYGEELDELIAEAYAIVDEE